jgi:hypothetical protein
LIVRSELILGSRPAVAKLSCVSEIQAEEIVNSLAFGVEYDQALRVFLLRSRYKRKVALLSKMIQYMLENKSVSFAIPRTSLLKLMQFCPSNFSQALGPSRHPQNPLSASIFPATHHGRRMGPEQPSGAP